MRLKVVRGDKGVKPIKSKKEDKVRKESNDELLERMKDPDDSLTRCKPSDTWFPKRGKIEKDEEEIKRLYNDNDEQDKQ